MMESMAAGPTTTLTGVAFTSDRESPTRASLGGSDSEGSGPGHPTSSRGHARSLNVEGAYPLLLIGGALIVYGVIVGLQVPPPTIGRFEIWQLMIVLGTTIAAAGVFSLYFAEEERRSAARTSRAVEGPSPSNRIRAPVPAPSSVAPTAPSTAPWWEGPPESAAGRRPAPARASTDSSSIPFGRPKSTPPSVTTPPPADAGSTSRSPTSEDEIANTLKELEAISREITSSSALAARPAPTKSQARRCSDCGRSIEREASRPSCSRCGRPLCTECAEASLLQTAMVTCSNCRGTSASVA